MMLVFNVVLIVSSLFIFCNAEFADTLPKCSIKDNECMRSLYQNIIHDIGKTGISDVGIPPLDNLRITNISVTLLEAIKFTINEGFVNGVSDCVFNKFSINLPKLSSTQDMTCDLSVKGKFSATGTSSALEALLGKGLLNGQWNGEIKLKKVNMQINIPFIVYKKEDGETYFEHVSKNVNFEYSIEKIIFFFEEIKIGNNDITKALTDFLNENWASLLGASKKELFAKALEIFFEISKNFFGGIPTRKYIIEDLTSYIKN